jgi:hypothetical protein
MAQIPLKTRRRLARGFSRRVLGPWAGRNFIGLGNRATLTTAQGANKDVLFFSTVPGTVGNAITVRYVNPGTANAALSVSVAASAITVNLATNGSSALTSTANDIVKAVNLFPAADALVWAQLAPGSDGTGIPAAFAATNLAGATARGAY